MTPKRCIQLVAILCFLLLNAPVHAQPAKDKVGPVPKSLRKKLKLSPFYKKHLDVGGMPNRKFREGF